MAVHRPLVRDWWLVGHGDRPDNEKLRSDVSFALFRRRNAVPGAEAAVLVLGRRRNHRRWERDPRSTDRNEGGSGRSRGRRRADVIIVAKTASSVCQAGKMLSACPRVIRRRPGEAYGTLHCGSYLSPIPQLTEYAGQATNMTAKAYVISRHRNQNAENNETLCQVWCSQGLCTFLI